DAMAAGGDILIETDNVDLTDEQLDAEGLSLRAGRYVLLAISDNGVGMDDQTRAHAFEPFFTTKAKGKGTGLGLAVVYGIVKQSGGYVFSSSAPGEGTTFRIDLPRVEAKEPEPPRAVPETRAASGGQETILLAEDEDRIRSLMVEVLGGAGYTVLDAPDGAAALALASAYPDPIDLVLTDVVMPRVNGRE